MNMLTWNVRGLNNPIKDSVIKEIINRRHVRIAGFTKTQRKEESQLKLISIWGSSACGHIAANANESSSGGVLLIWNLTFFQSTRHFKGSRWIIAVGKLIHVNWECAIGVYMGATLQVNRRPYMRN